MIDSSNPTSLFFGRSLAQMANLRAQAEETQRQVSTGEKFTRSSQDPVASAQLRGLARSERLAQVDADNAATARHELSAASDAIDRVSGAMIRVRELALYAASGIAGPLEREAMAIEIEELRLSILDSANAQSVSGRPLFGGEGVGPAYDDDGLGNIAYQGTASAGTLELGPQTEVARGIIGPNAFNFDDAGGPTDVFAFLQSLAGALRGGAPDPAAAARDALSGIDNSIDMLSRAQATLGSKAAWVDVVSQSQTIQQENRIEMQGELGGVDLAQAIASLQNTLTTLEASQASFARLSSLSLFNAL